VASKKIQSLASLPVTSSGLDERNQDFARDLATEKYFQDLVSGNNQALNNFFQENPHLVESIKIKAIFLLNLILLGEEIKPYHISVTGFKPKLADDSAWELINLLKNLDRELSFDFYKLREVMPTIVIYYSDFLLKDLYFKTKDSSLLERARNIIEDDTCFSDLVDEKLIAQRFRLRALYYRRILASKQSSRQEELDYQNKIEENLILYRESFHPELGQKIILNKLGPTKSISELDQEPELLMQIYQEAKDLQEEVVIRSGANKDTCFYYQCTDCCKKDFPTVSLAEFLYIKNSLSKAELEDLVLKAEEIQSAHEKQYGTRLKVVDQTLPGKQKDNPNNFLFACPFLDSKDSCTIYENRPLACRTFGLSTIDSQTVQACKFYLAQYQYNSSHKNERDVYDSEPHTKMIGEINEDLAKKYGYAHMKQPVATLVAWLTE
jgi:Fe-S-cluster containining protein